MRSLSFWVLFFQGDTSSAFRLVQEPANFKLSLYWTRLQVGVKEKGGKQLWCTPNGLDLNFEGKIQLGNFVDPWLCHHCTMTCFLGGVSCWKIKIKRLITNCPNNFSTHAMPAICPTEQSDEETSGNLYHYKRAMFGTKLSCLGLHFVRLQLWPLTLTSVWLLWDQLLQRKLRNSRKGNPCENMVCGSDLFFVWGLHSKLKMLGFRDACTASSKVKSRVGFIVRLAQQAQNWNKVNCWGCSWRDAMLLCLGVQGYPGWFLSTSVKINTSMINSVMSQHYSGW